MSPLLTTVDILAMLYNPNNVALEASPLTTLIEQFVGNQLCLMLGYHISEKECLNPLTSIIPVVPEDGVEPPPDAWGHITCVRRTSFESKGFCFTINPSKKLNLASYLRFRP